MWLYRLAHAFILATVTVNANYTVSNNLTRWSMATCNLAEPNLTYVNKSYRTIKSQKKAANFWIGYQLAKMPFLFLGCGDWNNSEAFNIKIIGDCFHICGGETFGIKLTSGGDILSNNTSKRCRCVTSPVLENGNQNGTCSTSFPAAIFSPIYVNSSMVSTSHSTSGDCLLYIFPNFLWGDCQRTDNIQVMCGKGPHTGSNTTAAFVPVSSTGTNYLVSWSAANGLCLKSNNHPASMESITNGNFTPQQQQYYWTGIIRSTAIIKSTNAEKFTIYPMQQFAFLENGSCVLQFASECVKKTALCIQGLSTTEKSNSPPSSDDVCTNLLSTTEESISKEFPVGIGIGVAVGTLCVVGAVIVIFILKRRGDWSCKLGTKTEEPDAGNLAFASRSYQETVGNHNYFILEKQAQSFEGNTNHYSTSDEPNVDNRETDHYSSIEEPYQTVKDDYDYTTNALRTGPNTRKPDDIYNKLKLDRPGDYDHVGRLGNNMPQPGSDYDTSAFAQKIAGGDDYNHIQLRVSA